MKTLMEMVAFMGEPRYNENLSNYSLFGTVAWAWDSICHHA